MSTTGPAAEGVGQPPMVAVPPGAGNGDRSLGYDPLADQRHPAQPVFDVLCAGTVFLDVIFTGLPCPPRVGAEVWAEGMGSSPGGVANMAIALSRLGLRTGLASPFGADVYGDFCWQLLEEQEGVDLSTSRRFPGWHSPVTVSMAYDRDRAMVTHGHSSPVPYDTLIGTPPASRAVVTTLGPDREEWPRVARRAGAMVVADVGWDPSEVWSEEVLRRLDDVDAFVPNAPEAMAYTRTDTPEAALRLLAEQVPLAVVTMGADGAIAADSESGETARVPALATESLDPTGAGDVFMAGLVTGTLSGWPLEVRVRFATLCAGLSVRHFGGSLSAPGWADLVEWWAGVHDTHNSRDADLVSSYGFLADVLPAKALRAVRRATATIGLRTPR